MKSEANSNEHNFSIGCIVPVGIRQSPIFQKNLEKKIPFLYVGIYDILINP
jgi:hypothetical protein